MNRGEKGNMLFDLRNAFYAMAGASVGAIAGYLFGVVLYIVVLCSSVFTTGGTPAALAIGTLITSAGVYPLMFAVLTAAIGFFAGWYIGYDKTKAP